MGDIRLFPSLGLWHLWSVRGPGRRLLNLSSLPRPPQPPVCPHHACVCRAAPSHCLYPSLRHAVPRSQPHPTPLLSNGHCLDGEAPPLNQGGKSRRAKSRHGGGPQSLSLSCTHPAGMSLTMNLMTLLGSLPLPPSQMGARVGFAVTLDVYAVFTWRAFSPRRPGSLPMPSWQQVGRPGCQRWHGDGQARPPGQDHAPSVPYVCPSL